MQFFLLTPLRQKKIPKKERKDFDYFVLKDESKKNMIYTPRNVPKRDGLYRFHENFEGERAIEFNLKYSDIGHEMDWFRWNDPGFAQRYQITEPLKKTTKKGKQNGTELVYLFLEKPIRKNTHLFFLIIK